MGTSKSKTCFWNLLAGCIVTCGVHQKVEQLGDILGSNFRAILPPPMGSRLLTEGVQKQVYAISLIAFVRWGKILGSDNMDKQDIGPCWP